MANRLLLAMAIIPFVTSIVFSQTQSPEKHVITTSELETQVELIGPLGVPVGKLVEIEGVAETRDGKVSNTWLSVESVNGKKLDKPVKVEYAVYHWANVTHLEDGKRLSLNVYQEIEMRGIPAGVTEQTTPVSAGWRRGLYTWIVVVNQTAPKKLKFRNPYYDNVVGGHPFDANIPLN